MVRSISPLAFALLFACSSDPPAGADAAPDAAIGGDAGASGAADAISGAPDATAGAPDATTSGAPDATSGAADAMAGAPDANGGGPDAAAGARDATTPAGSIPGPSERGVTRGGNFLGVPERFNRYYSDPAWTPATTLYVSPTGTGNGATRATPAAVASAFSRAQPGTRIHFLPGTYAGCFELDDAHSGTYDAPIVLYGERGAGGELAVQVDCCNTGRRTCFNLEAANYVAVDGFEVRGGRYGVRGVGSLTGDASTHQKGLAILSSVGHDQENDPFFTGQSDWVVIDGVLAYGAQAGDGHGIYLSNGSDYLLVRNTELHSNASSDFQINADPASTCVDEGIAVDDPRCDGPAASGQGEGVSEFVLLEYNYFHHGNAQGANFTSVRNSVVRNNFFGFYARHGVSFWQETQNPRLGSSDNQVIHNVFVSTNGRQALQFVEQSDRNLVANNLLIGVSVGAGGATANPNALLLEVDNTVGNNVWVGNAWVSGRLEGRTPNAQELVLPFDAGAFAGFGAQVTTRAAEYRPRLGSALAGRVPRRAEVPIDFAGGARADPTTPGMFEAQ